LIKDNRQKTNGTRVGEILGKYHIRVSA